eukprot:1145434-Pelagomonas_calceolata.AAC.1
MHGARKEKKNYEGNNLHLKRFSRAALDIRLSLKAEQPQYLTEGSISTLLFPPADLSLQAGAAMLASPFLPSPFLGEAVRKEALSPSDDEAKS